MAYDAFLKLTDVKGESQDDKHKGEIELLSFNFGVTQTGTSAHGSGMGHGKSELTDLHFVHHIDGARHTLNDNDIQLVFVGARFDESRMFDLLEFIRADAGKNRMRVRIDETRHDDATSGSDHFAIFGDQTFDFAASADGLYSIAAEEQRAVLDD